MRLALAALATVEYFRPSEVSNDQKPHFGGAFLLPAAQRDSGVAFYGETLTH